MTNPSKSDLDKMAPYDRQYWEDVRARHNRAERARGYPYQLRYLEQNPIRTRCHVAVQNAVKRGRLIRPSVCEECSSQAKYIDAHHDDYSKPLSVRWLCRACHLAWHDAHGPGINGDKQEFDMGMLDRFEKFADKTFNDAAAMYLSEFEGKCRTRQEYALQHIQPYIGQLKLIDVDDQALVEYKAARKQEAMVGTINKEISTATAVLNKACKVWRWIPSAPKLQRVKGDHKKPYPLSWKEQIEVFKRLCGDLQKIVLFAVNTGVRREEIFKLRWEDERNIDGAMVFILRDTKNGQDRPVILNAIARRIVGYMRDGHNEKGLKHPEFVFWPMTVSKVFNLAWVEAGLPDTKLVKKGIHNLRHTFGYRLRQAGVAGEDRDSLLGHHNRSLTQHYAAPDIKRLAGLVELITVRNDTAILR